MERTKRGSWTRENARARETKVPGWVIPYWSRTDRGFRGCMQRNVALRSTADAVDMNSRVLNESSVEQNSPGSQVSKKKSQD